MDSFTTGLGGIRAIIVAWNPGAWLGRCIASLTSEGLGPGQIWIVDHGTTDGSIVAAATASPGVNVIDHPANRSYGEAINRAAERCGGQMLLIVNPDTELQAGCVRSLITPLESDPAVAATGPRLLDLQGRDVTRFSRTRFYQGVLVLAFPGAFSGWRNRLTRRGRTSRRGLDVAFIEASVMMVRRQAFDAVGGFDEQFTFYGEDADLCWALRRSGHRLRHVPGAVAVHAVSASFGRSSDRQQLAFLDGMMRVAWKRSLRRYRWKRRWLLLMMRMLADAHRSAGSPRSEATESLIRRLEGESWRSPITPPGTDRVTMTVVIPTVARPMCVERLLSALSRQDDGAFDVVVVVQGSGEGYDAVLERWKGPLRLRRINHVRPNRGEAKNAGLRSTDADVVLFLDDDIVPGSDLVSAHRRSYRDPSCGAVSCRVVEEGRTGDEGDDRLRLTWYGRIVANTASRRSGPAEVAACGNMSFRRSPLSAFGGFDPRMRGTANLEEFDVSERLRAEGWTIWFDASAVVRHYPQEGGNDAARRTDAVSYYRDLHHNLGLIMRRHRPLATIPVAAIWAAGRSVRMALRQGPSLLSAITIWWGLFEGLETYRRDQQ